MKILRTDERIIAKDFKNREEYLTYLRHLFAYKFAYDYIPAHSFILEIGCGSGYGTKLLSKNAQKIVGLDIDKNIIEYVSNKYESENCFFKLYDGLKIPYSDNTFDVVVSFQVIEHIKDDAKIISEIYRVLKNNGIFIMTTPNRVFRMLKAGQKPQNKFHIREYSFQELERLLKNKFSKVNVCGIRGSERVQKIEKENIKLSLIVTIFDYFNLRRLIPKFIKQIIFKIIKKIAWARQEIGKEENFFEIYSVDDYFLIKNSDIDHNSIDLIGVSKK